MPREGRTPAYRLGEDEVSQRRVAPAGLLCYPCATRVRGRTVKLLVATRNPGKVRELRDLLVDLPIEVTFPPEVGLDLDVEETGATFAENASLKAQAFALASGLLTLADDSGLEVDALDGGPGVHSARYAGPAASDADRTRKLLAAMADVPDGQRSARFRCVVAVATPGGEVWLTEGTCEGAIASEPRGQHGFGYDPVFQVAGFGQRMAELPPDVKNLISHRGRALRAARPILELLLHQATAEVQDEL
jgi:XTP/dITP diphosphohydrolase